MFVANSEFSQLILGFFEVSAPEILRFFTGKKGRQMKKIKILLLCLSLLLLAANANALNITTYTDKNAWIAAVGAYMTESFEDAIFNTGVTVDSGTQGHVNPALEKWQDTLNSDSAKGSFTVWNFDPKMKAFGGTWTLGGPGGSGNYIEITLEEFSISPVAYISSQYNNEFWGFVSDVAFSKVKLTGGSADHQQSYDLDDMVYAAPLPGAVYLFGAGLLILGIRRKS